MSGPAKFPLSVPFLRAETIGADFSREQGDFDVLHLAIPDGVSIGHGMLRLVPDDPQYAATEEMAEVLEYFAKTQDCNCNAIEWEHGVCCHEQARAALRRAGRIS